MRIAGQEIKGAMEEVIILPRGEGQEDIVFKVKAVLDSSRFHKLCPKPEPKKMIKRGVGEVEDLDNPSYKRAVEIHNKLYTAFLILESLAPSDIEWDTVDIDDPGTWENYENDLKAAGFSDFERARILGGCMTVNALNEQTMKAARERFFLSQEALAGHSYSQNSEPNSIRSTEPVNGSA